MNEKQSLISELIDLSKVDGKVSEDEIGFIQQIGNMLGMANDEILELFKTPVPYNPPREHFERIVQLQRLILLMNVDEIADEQELIHIRNMGIKLGLNPDAVKEVLRVMPGYPNRVIPPEVLIEIYRTYMN